MNHLLKVNIIDIKYIIQVLEVEMKASIMSYRFASVTDSLSLSHSKIETDPQQGVCR